MRDIIDHIMATPYLLSLAIVGISVAVAFVMEAVAAKVLLKLASKTRTTLDDELVANTRKPLFLTVLFVGLSVALDRLPASQSVSSRAHSCSSPSGC